ncbi:MAG: hypothetical protein ACI4C0_00385 [Lachnospiraceae bacterium]
MRMRYYLRGLGIGIVVTALLMGFTKGGQKETLTDAEIVERAKSLGMVESSVLSADLGDKEDISVNDISEADQQEVMPETETETADNTEQTEPETTDNTEQSKPETADDTEQTKPETTDNTEQTKPEKETEADNPEEEETVTEKRYVVTIYSGDGSRTVANRLEEMGVIEDAAEFDRYLCQNGYDKRLTTGNHEINAGADEKEIAEALVKRVN